MSTAGTLLGMAAPVGSVQPSGSVEGGSVKNRFAGGCATCSVWVAAGSGFLGKGFEGGWEVQCPTCRYIDDLAAADDFVPERIVLPTTPPPGSAATVALRVLTLTRACWSCDKDTVSAAGLYPQRPARGYSGLFTTDNAIAMALVQRLLQQHGHGDLAATIKSRYSKTMRKRNLSNGCAHCDALQETSSSMKKQNAASLRVAWTGWTRCWSPPARYWNGRPSSTSTASPGC